MKYSIVYKRRYKLMRKLSVIIELFVLYCIYSVDTVDAFEE